MDHDRTITVGEPTFLQTELMKLLERHAAHFDMLNVRTTGTLMVVYQ